VSLYVTLETIETRLSERNATTYRLLVHQQVTSWRLGNPLLLVLSLHRVLGRRLGFDLRIFVFVSYF
jgi:hypothetical protein